MQKQPFPSFFPAPNKNPKNKLKITGTNIEKKLLVFQMQGAHKNNRDAEERKY